MLINWRAKGPLSIGHPNPELTKKALANRKDKTPPMVNTQLTVCIPGVNHLPDDMVWIKDHKVLARHIEEGKLVIVSEKDGNAEVAQKEHIAVELEGMELAKAERVVRMTLNKPLLDRWRSSDIRPAIRAAVEDQLDKLKIKPKKED